ncbi:MAG: RluA family pseudouridine synthase, partial [Oscillospiraceae bacterium]|nr:RluA family pseudouridine synthase [Oscillospiraceae bacterium]
MPNRQTLSVIEADIGKRLDIFLAEQISELSRSAAQKLVESGMVLVNGTIPQKKEKLRCGDLISVELPEEEDERPKPEAISLDILYEDEDLLIVNKPKGMVVHPAAGNKSGTLVNGLLYHCGGQLSDINGEIRPGILHRIDKNTSGLLMVAKNNDAHLFLAEQIQAHSFTREYRAILHGVVKEDSGSWDFPIGRHRIERKKMAVNGENPREAKTHFEVLERFRQFSYVKFCLETGRTHQIRVHASYAGYPVAGDDVYGPKRCITELNGQCLHAIKLGFIHPSTKE